MLNSPYSMVELKIAFMGVCNKLNDDTIKSIEEQLAPFKTEDKLDAAAKHHKITKDQLINSPNMKYLIDAYESHMFESIVDVIQKLGFSHKEAVAFFVAAMYPHLFGIEG